MSIELIPFQIETQRVIQLLARQIYQSPLALLRQNTQNAFDAIRQRLQLDKSFKPRIDIEVTPNRVVISDNGIGMTPDDLRKHYWTAGSSSKNNNEARSAGVVGTFGIGAMANFGIADLLTVETESALTGDRTLCRADKTKLSLKDDCIEQQKLPTKGQPGTTIIAEVTTDKYVNVAQAQNYIAEFVSLVNMPVYVNEELVSQRPIESAVPAVSEAWRFEAPLQKIGDRLTADVCLVLSNNADIWLKLTNLFWSDRRVAGQMLLRSGQSLLRTFRSGFGLATASVNSAYQFGGIADLLALEPTAGREAITVDGMQLLQSMMNDIDAFVSLILSSRDECDASTSFMHWVISHNCFGFCSRMKMSVYPGDRISLAEVTIRSKAKPMMVYDESDQGVIKMHATEENPLLVLARSNPRRICEYNYLREHAKITVISNTPVIEDRRTQSQFSIAESGLAYRVQSILNTDYFLITAVDMGKISHGLPVFVEMSSDGVRIT